MMKFKLSTVSTKVETSNKANYEKLGFTLTDVEHWTEANEINIEIETIEDLKKIQDTAKEELIINFDDMTIMIYDGYNE